MIKFTRLPYNSRKVTLVSAVSIGMHVQLLNSYFWRVQMIQASLAVLLILWGISYLAAKVIFRVFNCRLGRWNVGVPVLAIPSALLGLVLATSYYYCPICQTRSQDPAWCEVGIAGMPIPSSFFIYDLPDVGPATTVSDSCGEWTGSPRYVRLDVAAVLNFVIGAVTLPSVIALAVKISSRTWLAGTQNT